MSAILERFHIDPRRRWLVVPLVVVVLFLAGYLPRYLSRRRLAAQASTIQSSAPRVKVATAVAAGGGRTLSLPGTLQPYQDALISARASGYVRRWLVDIGARVRDGDTLAELDTPELDQQLAQARSALTQKNAALAQAAANLDYANVTARRGDALLAEALTSKQTNDQAHAQVNVWVANVDAAKADVAAAQANVRQLAQLVSFGRVVAPFNGRITQRNIDVGSLVAAGGQPLFHIEADDPIRVFIQTPQAFALSVKDKEAAKVTVRQIPGRVFDGQVTRTAGALDPTSRTLNVEVDVPNPKGELLPGMFAQVEIAVAVAHRVVRVPSSAVILDARGSHVATVDGGGQVHLVTVVRGLDNGAEIDVIDGLSGGEQVIATPSADVTDGMRVTAVTGP